MHIFCGSCFCFFWSGSGPSSGSWFFFSTGSGSKEPKTPGSGSPALGKNKHSQFNIQSISSFSFTAKLYFVGGQSYCQLKKVIIYTYLYNPQNFFKKARKTTHRETSKAYLKEGVLMHRTCLEFV